MKTFAVEDVFPLPTVPNCFEKISHKVCTINDVHHKLQYENALDRILKLECEKPLEI